MYKGNKFRTPPNIMIEALRILEKDIQSRDGTTNACIGEAALLIEELIKENDELKELLREGKEHIEYFVNLITPRKDV